MNKTTLIIKDEDIAVRKKQPPSGGPMRDPKAYQRNPKHKKRDGAHGETPEGEDQPGAAR